MFERLRPAILITQRGRPWIPVPYSAAQCIEPRSTSASGLRGRDENHSEIPRRQDAIPGLVVQPEQQVPRGLRPREDLV